MNSTEAKESKLIQEWKCFQTPGRMFIAFAVIAGAAAVLIDAHALMLAFPVGDLNCYGLPGANWLATGRMAIPQFDDQYDLDKYWRFSAPWLNAGPALFFGLGDIGHDWYVWGCLSLVILTMIVFYRLFRKSVPSLAWIWPVFLTVGIVTNRAFFNELVNQRYTILVYPCIALLYFPFPRTNGKAPWFQWWIAGSLVLIHPATVPIAAIWLIFEFGSCLVTRKLPFSWTGIIGFSIGFAFAAYWYLDPQSFRTQFVPHLKSRAFVPFSGWNLSLTWKYLLPSIFTLIGVYVSISLSFASPRSDKSSRLAAAKTAAMVLILTIQDVFGRMPYLNLAILGVAPAALSLIPRESWKRIVVMCWLILAIAQIAVEWKMWDSRFYYPVSRSEAAEFLLANSLPGDRIVVGPPFALSAASDAQLPEGRKIVKVVPMCIYLDEFQVDRFIERIREETNVYIGFPDYFDKVQFQYKTKSPPIFEPARIEEVPFRDRTVMIARPAQPVDGKTEDR